MCCVGERVEHVVNPFWIDGRLFDHQIWQDWRMRWDKMWLNKWEKRYNYCLNCIFSLINFSPAVLCAAEDGLKYMFGSVCIGAVLVSPAATAWRDDSLVVCLLCLLYNIGCMFMLRGRRRASSSLVLSRGEWYIYVLCTYLYMYISVLYSCRASSRFVCMNMTRTDVVWACACERETASKLWFITVVFRT